MDLGLKDKVAIVTGAGSQIGFGKAISLTLAENGCHVITADIDLAGAQKTADAVRATGCRSQAFRVDISKSPDVREMVKEVLNEFGKIDILVNNAGVSTPPQPFLNMTEENWDRDININFKGVLYCTRAVLPSMLERKYGKIINISSGAGIRGAANLTVYAATKAAIIAFSKSLTMEMKHVGININCVCPGMAMTGFAPQAPPGFIDDFAARTVVGRLTTPQDVANTVTFLASDVSSDIVGQVIGVEGSP